MVELRIGAPAFGPRGPVETLVARYGAWRVLALTVAAALRGTASRDRQRPGPGRALPDHLRRDIGLGPEPPPATWRYWV
ncbi:hypothetical protein [Acidimangrovimonas pyrenivorans]|uniref:DUF1127 domain-containing protein n=1 Tax=Acidimangrovimonas pyrenivorans TaxID=2030798 RepID=A0ABV7AI44_9RHOB